VPSWSNVAFSIRHPASFETALSKQASKTSRILPWIPQIVMVQNQSFGGEVAEVDRFDAVFAGSLVEVLLGYEFGCEVHVRI
jgi:hypothetical protein